MSRRAKIVCTLGPATSSAEQIARLVEAGLDVARLNLSHGSYADHEVAFARVRAASSAAAALDTHLTGATVLPAAIPPTARPMV